jgi:acyl-homoserine lactone acylase PvdQ
LDDDDLKQSGIFSHEGVLKVDRTKRNKDRYADFGAGFLTAFAEGQMNDFKESISPMGASNAWAVSGKFTKSGKPILSSDPHLANQIPSLWYLIELNSDEGFHGTGSSFVGYPGLAQGRTDFSAWGVSNTKTDNIDFFQEKIDIENEKYFYDGEWRDLIIRKDTIEVKGQEPQEFKVYSTQHGPVFRGIQVYSKLNFIIPGLVPINMEDFSIGWAFLHLEDSSN